MRSLLAIFALALVASCDVDPRAARGDFIVDALVADNEDLLLRDPNEVALKWARMAESPFLFFRGNVGIWARDATAPGYEPAADADPVSSAVLLVGDPHPENFGSFRTADGRQIYDVNDFDGAGYGPFFFDVRRLALGFAVGLREVLPDDQALLAADAVAEGYADAAAEPEVIVTPGNAPVLVQDIFAKAAADIAGGSHGVDIVDGRLARSAQLATERGPDDDIIEDVAQDAMAALEPALERYRSDVGERARVVDIARIRGSGVGSYSLLRYVALLDDGTEVELKEARDPLRVVGLSVLPSRPFDDDASRVVFAQRALQALPNEDARLGVAPMPPLGFKVRDDSLWQRTQRIARIGKLVSRGASMVDVVALARLDGALLFHAHARAPAPDGRSIKPELTAVVRRIGPALERNTHAFLRRAVVAHDDDLALFRERLAQDPLLGWRP